MSKRDQLELMSKLVKTYFPGDANPKKFYLVQNQICEISPEIIGTPCNQLRYGSGEQIEANTRIYRWRETWEELTQDPLFKGLPKQTQSHFRLPDISLSNVIVTPDNCYYIIDW